MNVKRAFIQMSNWNYPCQRHAEQFHRLSRVSWSFQRHSFYTRCQLTLKCQQTEAWIGCEYMNCAGFVFYARDRSNRQVLFRPWWSSKWRVFFDRIDRQIRKCQTRKRQCVGGTNKSNDTGRENVDSWKTSSRRARLIHEMRMCSRQQWFGIQQSLYIEDVSVSVTAYIND